MITNLQEYQAATEEQRKSFRAKLAGTINKWRWRDGQWELEQDTREIERFGLGVDDFESIPEPPKPDYNLNEKNLQSAKEDAVERIRQGYSNALASLTDNYPALEREGWSKQEREARAVKDGGSSALIAKMASLRGITEAEMSDRIIAKADAYADVYADTTATLHNLEDEIEAAYSSGDQAALEAVDWPQ